MRRRTDHPYRAIRVLVECAHLQIPHRLHLAEETDKWHPDPITVDALDKEAARRVIPKPPRAIEDVRGGLANEHEIDQLLAAMTESANEGRSGVVHVLADGRHHAGQQDRAHEAQDSTWSSKPRVHSLLEELLRVRYPLDMMASDHEATRSRSNGSGRRRGRSCRFGTPWCKHRSKGTRRVACWGHLADRVVRRWCRVEEHGGQSVSQHRRPGVLLRTYARQGLVPSSCGCVISLAALARAEQQRLDDEALDGCEDTTRPAMPLPEAPFSSSKRTELEAHVKPSFRILNLWFVTEDEPNEFQDLPLRQVEFLTSWDRCLTLAAFLLRRGTRARREGILWILARKLPWVAPIRWCRGRNQGRRWLPSCLGSSSTCMVL
mmetsp:Transcript_42374/g.106822  ORF Transcript_42374/g.106822 Transcript_42374/m.106822 type:complete len:377 (-) Transcript_42374:105-1235(-)